MIVDKQIDPDTFVLRTVSGGVGIFFGRLLAGIVLFVGAVSLFSGFDGESDFFTSFAFMVVGGGLFFLFRRKVVEVLHIDRRTNRVRVYCDQGTQLTNIREQFYDHLLLAELFIDEAADGSPRYLRLRLSDRTARPIDMSLGEPDRLIQATADEINAWLGFSGPPSTL